MILPSIKKIKHYFFFSLYNSVIEQFVHACSPYMNNPIVIN